jgi:signal transduction histidine kinase
VDPRQDTISRIHRACDLVFGSTIIVLGVIGSWFYVLGEVQFPTVAGLWTLFAFNVLWSVLTRNRDRVRVVLLRGLFCLPITVFLYVADTGLFERLWIPAIVMAIGIAVETGIASGGIVLGHVATIAYAGAVFGAGILRAGRIDPGALDDAIGIAMAGCMISLVSSKLRRTFDEARRQRDVARAQQDRAEAVLEQLTLRSRELTTAIESLHHEMEHRTRVEVELRQALKLESVGRLAAGVAHEINTPVQFVSDSLQFVREGVADLFAVVDKLEVVHRSVVEGAPSLDAAALAAAARDNADLPYLVEHVPRALERAREGLDRVATIVRSMKEFAHPDAKDMELADLNHAIESTLTIARNEYKGVAELETDLGDLPHVRCHVGELNQAVLNIVINAAHAIDDVVRGTCNKGRIRVHTHRDRDEVVIAIADTGAGIPESIRNRIFDPFFTTKAVGRGTGQGLAIAHSVIVEKHHGKLGFETAVGGGTTFTIRLPIAGRPGAGASAASAA